MSQLSHPTTPIRSQVQAHKAAWMAALLTLIATAAVVLVLAIDGDWSDTSPTQLARPSLSTDGGLSESGVAASVGSRPSTGPSESNVAAAVAGARAPRVTGGPDESSVAASLSESSQPRRPGPDEAATANAISAR